MIGTIDSLRIDPVLPFDAVLGHADLLAGHGARSTVILPRAAGA